MAMTAAGFLAAAEALPLAPLATILAPGGLLVLAPHPDDESLGCGGTIAAARAAGREVAVVFVSDGAGSHPRSRRFAPPRLAALRAGEAQAALQALGLPPGAGHFLGLPDTAVPESGPAFLTALAAIEEVIGAIGAGTLLASWGHDPHCDHQAVHAMAATLAARHPRLRHLAYMVWGHALPPETPIPEGRPRGARLDITAFLPAKRAAIAAHRSQTTALIDDDPEGFCLSDAMLARFDRPFEILLQVPA